MQRTGRTKGLWATLGVVAMMALLVPAFASAAPPAPVAAAGSTSAAVTASASASQQWAYGGSKWVNVTTTVGNASYTAKAFFGWQVVLTATNTSATTVELEAQRTMGASFFANYCAPNCTHPSTSGNISIVGSQSDVGFANLTATATVYENGSAVPAVGIANASSRGNAHLNESFTLAFGGHTSNGHLTVAGASHAQVAFSPALGLVPWNVSNGTDWNSSAAFTASGAWSLLYNYSATSFLGSTVSGSGGPSATVNASGNVAVRGGDLGTITLANGKTVPVIAIVVSGPFDDEDGFILVPHDFDMFNGGVHEYDSHAFGDESAATSRLDISVDALHHRFGVVASATAFAGAGVGLSGSGSPALAAPGATASPSTALVQAQPESVAQAQQAANCLAGTCPKSSTSGVPTVALLVVGLISLAAVGAVGAVAYRASSRRGRGGAPPVGAISPPPSAGPLGVPPPPPAGPAPPMPPSGGA